MPDRHFYLLRHHILFYIYFWFSVYWCQIEINLEKKELVKKAVSLRLLYFKHAPKPQVDMVFFLFSDYPKFTVGENGNSPEGFDFHCYFLMENFSLVNSHNLLGNPLIHIQNLNTNFHLESKHRKAEI